MTLSLVATSRLMSGRQRPIAIVSADPELVLAARPSLIHPSGSGGSRSAAGPAGENVRVS
jgi:hypothetical protein